MWCNPGLWVSDSGLSDDEHVRTWIEQGSGPCGDGEGGRGVIGRGGDENAIQITIYSYKYLIIYDFIIGENLLLTIIIGENFYYKGPSRQSYLTENFWFFRGGAAPPAPPP